MVAQAPDSNSQKTEAGGSQVPGSQDYIISSGLKKTKQEKKVEGGKGKETAPKKVLRLRNFLTNYIVIHLTKTTGLQNWIRLTQLYLLGKEKKKKH